MANRGYKPRFTRRSRGEKAAEAASKQIRIQGVARKTATPLACAAGGESRRAPAFTLWATARQANGAGGGSSKFKIQPAVVPMSRDYGGRARGEKGSHEGTGRKRKEKQGITARPLDCARGDTP